MLKLFKDRNFFTFWIGEFISVIGDHISLIAFPFLVLQMTGSPALTAFVFAAQGLPRAVMMLVGGAVVDRTSPRLVMILSNLARCVLVMLLAYLVHVDQVSIQIIFIIALLFGLADAFFYPASTSMVPTIVAKDNLKEGNAIIQSSIFVGVIIGPAIAGLVIAGHVTTLGHDVGLEAATYQSNRPGFARAFFIDGLTFAMSFITLLFVKARSLSAADDEAETGKESATSVLAEVKEAVRWVWSVPALRLGFIGIAILEFFFQTPIFVGLPALAKTRFLEPAYVYGLIIAAYGVGAVLGSVVGGATKGPKPENLVQIMFFIFIGSGAAIGLMVIYPPYWFAMTLFLFSGFADSYIWVHFTTLVQKATPEKLLGRVMSIFMFMSVGLIPIASIIMGIAFEWNLEASLMIASIIIVVSCLVAAMHPDSKKVPIVDLQSDKGDAGVNA
ncbi:MFS transporter [Kordiimonas aquimaris]|uniref:MFS transporter n=1 Tax=Kordiimonas aquimaris TaxID=707591 RepID=UPI0021D11C17|nr:MFS transporter [Kordiimonas aquimaris]